MLIRNIRLRLTGDGLLNSTKAALGDLYSAILVHDNISPEAKPNWVTSSNATIALSLIEVFKVIESRGAPEVGRWINNIYAFNQLAGEKRWSKDSIGLLYLNTGVVYPSKSMRQLGLRAAKVVGMALFFMAKRNVIFLPVSFNYPSSNWNDVDFCAKSLPIHFRLARAIRELTRKRTESLFDSYCLPITEMEVRQYLTADDIVHAPSYVTRVFVSLNIYNPNELNSDQIRAFYQWQIKYYGDNHYNVLRNFSKLLALVLRLEGYGAQASDMAELSTNLSFPVPLNKVIQAEDEDSDNKVREVGLAKLNNESEDVCGGDSDTLRAVQNGCTTGTINKVLYRWFRCKAKEVSSSDDYYGVIQKIVLKDARPDILRKNRRLGGEALLDTELIWLDLQRSFLEHGKFENGKGYVVSFSYLNKYIFGYLRKWFLENQSVAFEFPSVPDEFRSGFYVLPIRVRHDEVFPNSLQNFVRAHSITSTSAQSILRSIAAFFEWITVYAKHLSGCTKFVLPMTSRDYPKAKRPGKTNKGRIPRYIFPSLMSYLYALHAWIYAEHSAVAGGLKVDHSAFVGKNEFDWSYWNPSGDWSGVVALCPLVAVEKSGVVRLERIPWLPNIFSYTIGMYYNNNVPFRGEVRRGLVPNALVQILACLETGQRHQNIQWLDRDSYSVYFQDDLDKHNGTVRLFVNTDKIREKPFDIIASDRIVEVFALQEMFNSLLDKKWKRNFYYEGNNQSKWGEINCLFQHLGSGAPHSDSYYTHFWYQMLQAFQVFLSDIGEPLKAPLVQLLPTHVEPGDYFYIENDDSRVVQIQEVYADECFDNDLREFIFLVPKSKLSPHSTRSTVISNGISFLPADFIGQHMTGQTPAVVYYYAVMDEEQTSQLFCEYDRSQKASVVPVLPKTDIENSAVRQAFERDRNKALVDFGCISITSTLESGDRCGIEMTKATDIKGFDFGRLRICPLNGCCPEEIVTSVGAKNCPECYLAVFSVDHLPAINCEIRNRFDDLQDLKVSLSDSHFLETLSDAELKELRDTKIDLARRLAAWYAVSLTLETNRQSLLERDSFLVGRPDLVRNKIVAIDGKGLVQDGFLLRLEEALVYHLSTSQRLKAQMRKLTRRLLAHINKIDTYESHFDIDDPSRELSSLIKTVSKAYHVTPDELVATLTDDMKPPLLPLALKGELIDAARKDPDEQY